MNLTRALHSQHLPADSRRARFIFFPPEADQLKADCQRQIHDDFWWITGVHPEFFYYSLLLSR